MTLYCGGCIHEVETGYGMIYRLAVVDGKPLGPDHRIKDGSNQPNCAMCDKCWATVSSEERLTETQALAARGDLDHVYAYCPADSGTTSFGTKQWSSIKTEDPVAFLSLETVARYTKLKAIIDGIHDRQVTAAARQELCDAKACDCYKQERKAHDKGDYGVHAGTRVRWKERTPGTIWEPDSPQRKWIEGEVVRHDHPPHANYHTVKADDGSVSTNWEVFKIEAASPFGRSNFGGCVGLRIPDMSKLDRAKALEAFRVLWKDAAARVLAAIPTDGVETGATFTAVAEEYAVFEKLIAGSGVEVDLTIRAPTQAELKAMGVA